MTVKLRRHSAGIIGMALFGCMISCDASNTAVYGDDPYIANFVVLRFHLYNYTDAFATTDYQYRIEPDLSVTTIVSEEVPREGGDVARIDLGITYSESYSSYYDEYSVDFQFEAFNTGMWGVSRVNLLFVFTLSDGSVAYDEGGGWIWDPAPGGRTDFYVSRRMPSPPESISVYQAQIEIMASVDVAGNEFSHLYHMRYLDLDPPYGVTEWSQEN